MVVELFAHTVGVVKNGPFLPNYSGPIRVKGALPLPAVVFSSLFHNQFSIIS